MPDPVVPATRPWGPSEHRSMSTTPPPVAPIGARSDPGRVRLCTHRSSTAASSSRSPGVARTERNDTVAGTESSPDGARSGASARATGSHSSNATPSGRSVAGAPSCRRTTAAVGVVVTTVATPSGTSVTEDATQIVPARRRCAPGTGPGPQPDRSTSVTTRRGEDPGSLCDAGSTVGSPSLTRWGSQRSHSHAGARSGATSRTTSRCSGPRVAANCNRTARASAAGSSPGPHSARSELPRSTPIGSSCTDSSSTAASSSTRRSARPPAATTTGSIAGPSPVPMRTRRASGWSGWRSHTRRRSACTHAATSAPLGRWRSARSSCSARRVRACSTARFKSLRKLSSRKRRSRRCSRRTSMPEATTNATLNSTKPVTARLRVATHIAAPISSGTAADRTGKPGSRSAEGGVGSSTDRGWSGSTTAGIRPWSRHGPSASGGRSGPSIRTVNVLSPIRTMLPWPSRTPPRSGVPSTSTRSVEPMAWALRAEPTRSRSGPRVVVP